MFLVSRYHTYNAVLDEPWRYTAADGPVMMARRLAGVFDAAGPVRHEPPPADWRGLAGWAGREWDADLEVVDLDASAPGPGGDRLWLAVFSADPHLDLERVYRGSRSTWLPPPRSPPAGRTRRRGAALSTG
jgi:hypothetical protein